MSDRPEWIITAAELKEKLGKVVLVDVREPEEHEELRIEGCILMPMDEIQGRAEAELAKDAEIILYCAHGMRSVQALMSLKMLGFENVRSLDGGICAWEEQGFPCRNSTSS